MVSIKKSSELPLSSGPLSDCILVAEDNESDLLLLQRALKYAGVLCSIHVVQDGEQAIAYLKGEGEYANRMEYPLPSLVLLDLKMPGKSGFEVLQWIRNHPIFYRLPVLVLTISNQIADIRRAYALGANSFINKSLDYQSTKDLAQSIRQFWLSLSQAAQPGASPDKSPKGGGLSSA
jgi:CheY-like chemotaxis protein